MQFDISRVHWPEDPRQAGILCSQCVLVGVERLGIVFKPGSDDPIEISRRYARGEADDVEAERARTYWWDFIEAHNGLTNFKDHDMLMARVALCVLPPAQTGRASLEETLESFLDFVRRLELPVAVAFQAVVDTLTPHAT